VLKSETWQESCLAKRFNIVFMKKRNGHAWLKRQSRAKKFSIALMLAVFSFVFLQTSYAQSSSRQKNQASKSSSEAARQSSNADSRQGAPAPTVDLFRQIYQQQLLYDENQRMNMDRSYERKSDVESARPSTVTVSPAFREPPARQPQKDNYAEERARRIEEIEAQRQKQSYVDRERILNEEQGLVNSRRQGIEPVIDKELDKQVGGALVVNKLRGVVLVSDERQIKKDGAKDVNGIDVIDLPLLDNRGFAKRFMKYLDKPTSMENLKAMMNDVVAYYRENDRPVVDVRLPEQDVTNGVVQILVIEGRLGQVRATGNKWFKSKTLTGQVRALPGGEIRESSLQDDVAWLNTNPFREVKGVFVPGKEKGTTDIELQTKDRLPARFYAGYEDSGSDMTGNHRWTAGGTWGNVCDLDHQLSYQLSSVCGDVDLYRAHSLSYLAPLPWHHRVILQGGHAITNANLETPLFDLSGESWQVGLRYAVPLPSLKQFKHELTGGFDFKESNNNLEYGGVSVFDNRTAINQFALGYTASLPDSLGYTSVGANGFVSPGSMLGKNTDQDFQKQRWSSNADYVYGKFNIERRTRLPWNFSWTFSGTLQLAGTNLLGSEQLGLGGASSVRGYEEREVSGDNGVLFSNELRTAPISFVKLMGWEKIKFQDQLQFLVFQDYGDGWSDDKLPGEASHTDLLSVGPGLRYAVGQNFALRFDYGFQLTDSGVRNPHGSRAHVGVQLAY